MLYIEVWRGSSADKNLRALGLYALGRTGTYKTRFVFAVPANDANAAIDLAGQGIIDVTDAEGVSHIWR